MAAASSIDRSCDGSAARSVDLGDLALERGGHLLVKRAVAGVAVGERVAVHGRDPALAATLRAFCRARGLDVAFERGPGPDGTSSPFVAEVIRTAIEGGRSAGAERAGSASLADDGAVAGAPPLHWGLAPRGALVERGGPDFGFALAKKDGVWADEAPRLYAQAAAAQWDPATAIDWSSSFELADEIEDAVVQLMTYLIENETAALLVPARFVASMHPHFREVMQLLAIQAADEARHIEVFTRRATLKRSELGLSTVGGQASLKTLLDEPDFALASFLLSVLGEGSFLSLLRFLRDHAPDPVTRAVAELAAQDEARHVAFGLAHLAAHATAEPRFLERLARAVEQRHAALQHTAGLNEEVFDALVLLAAGSFEPAALAKGHDAVVQLVVDMDAGRRFRLERLGFSSEHAERLSSLHTRNFM
jgi:hypothetical protein